MAVPHQAALGRGSAAGDAGGGVPVPVLRASLHVHGPSPPLALCRLLLHLVAPVLSRRGAPRGPRSLIYHQHSWKLLSWHYRATPLLDSTRATHATLMGVDIGGSCLGSVLPEVPRVRFWFLCSDGGPTWKPQGVTKGR